MPRIWGKTAEFSPRLWRGVHQERPGVRLWTQGEDDTMGFHKGRAKTEHVGGLKGGGRRIMVGVRHGRPGTTASFLNYLTRDGVGVEGGRGRLFDAYNREPETQGFIEQAKGDRLQYLVLLSPEMAAWIDVRRFTREVMTGVEQQAGQGLDWVAAAHYNTAHVHVQGIIRGRDVNGEELWTDRQGLQHHLEEAATQVLSSREPRSWARSREGWERSSWGE
jgi:type IV secretory pathway VirD2 relaxase